MAEGFVRNIADEEFEALSCGMEPKPVHPTAVEVMNEIGIDISKQESKDVGEFLGKVHLDYLVVVCDKAQKSCPRIWPSLSTRLYWPFEDPAEFEGTEEETLDKFREVRDRIKQKIVNWLKEEKG